MSEGRASATIRVTRDRARSKDRRRAYEIWVNGIQVGQVLRGETKDLSVAPGARTLRISIDFEHSREWECDLSAGDVVSFICRSRGKKSDGNLDLFLAHPASERVRLRPLGPLADRDGDPARKQRVVTRDGQDLLVWAHRSGYLRSFDPGSDSSDGDAFLLGLVLYVLVMPVLCLLRWVRHRFLFKRGWSVGVVRKRRLVWPKKVRLERYPTEGEARAQVDQVIRELESHGAR